MTCYTSMQLLMVLITSIHLNNWQDNICRESSEPQWNPPELVPLCLLSHLNTISMRGFNGKLDEMEAAKYLLKNGEVLKKMTIYTHDPLRPKELYKELSTCQRGSETCQVEVIWDAVIMVLNRFRYQSCKSIIFVCTRWICLQLAVFNCRILLSTLNFRVIQLWWRAERRMCMVWFLWFFFRKIWRAKEAVLVPYVHRSTSIMINVVLPDTPRDIMNAFFTSQCAVSKNVCYCLSLGAFNLGPVNGM